MEPDQRDQEVDMETEDHRDEEKPQAHTSPEEGHPAGEGERSDREVGGPTSPDDPPDEDVTGKGKGTRENDRFDSHS